MDVQGTIESDATGSDLLKAVGALLDVPQDLSTREHLDAPRDLLTRHEIVKVFSDLVQMKIISPTELINANDGDIFQIQPYIPPAQACPVALIIGSKSDEPVIDFRRICISSGQLNLSTDIPQNSLRSIIAKLVGGSDRIDDIDVVMEKDGVQTPESEGIFALGTQIADGAKHFSHVRITVNPDFPEFNHLASDRIRHKDQTPLPSFPQPIPTTFSDSPSDKQFLTKISRPGSQNDSKS
jgi:hypothetical protein